MTEWFCTKCYSVFHQKAGKCCGTVEKFNLKKHGRKLIPGSNGWNKVWDKWSDNPIVEKFINKHIEDGDYSAPNVLNDFIEYLYKMK